MLDTRLGLMTPDEGLVGPSSLRQGGRKPAREEVTKVRLERRKGRLNIDRMSWWPNWMDLNQQFLPYRGRLVVGGTWDTNKGWRRNWAIVDSTALEANNTMRAGLLSGTASEARPWFAYEPEDESLTKARGVNEWFAYTTKVARSVLAKSNFYNSLSECFGEYGVFGSLGLGRGWPAPRRDEADIPYFQPFTIGSYYIANDERGRVNTWFRDYVWTVEQIVREFGIRQPDGTLDPSKPETFQNISRYVEGMWRQELYDTWVPIVHAVEENPNYKAGALGPRGQRFMSVRYERGGEPDKILKNSQRKSEAEQDEDNKLLRVKGFRSFPVFCARWYTNSEDAWGRGPAMDCLGDARALQLQQKRKAQAIDKHVDPPMVAHPSLRNQRTSQLPGDVTFAAPEGNQIGFQPAYLIKPETQDLLLDIKETQTRIQQVMHADIFQLFIQAERQAPGREPITAAEVNAKQQEKLMMLGPVLGQMNFDLFNPLHDWLFSECMHHGLFPPPPPALRGAAIKVKYTSILAQAINAITSQSIDQLTDYVIKIAQAEQLHDNPALDKFDADKAIELKGKAVGAPPEILRDDDTVAQIRNKRAQVQAQQAAAEQQAQQAAAAEAHAGAAQKLSQTPVGQGGGSALDLLAQAAGAQQSQ